MATAIGVVLAVLGVVAAVGVGPGLLAIRRLNWPADLKLVSAVALSWVMVYAAGLIVSVAGAPKAGWWAIAAAGAVCTALATGELRRMWRRRAVRRLVIGFSLTAAGALLAVAVVRNYGGGDWFGDWIEHYQRSRYWACMGYDETYLKLSPIPGRPPLQSVAGAYVMGILGDRFDAHQVVYGLLGVMAALPVAVLGRRWGGRRGAVMALCLFALSPVVVQNTVWAWTKLPTAFYVVLGVDFYLRARRHGNVGMYAAAFGAIGAGCLVHFGAMPFLLSLGGHATWECAHRRRWRQLAAGATAATVMLGLWFPYSIGKWGVKETATSNTAVIHAEKYTLMGNVGKVAVNVVRTLLPHPAFMSFREFKTFAGGQSTSGFVRDYAFLIYQPNLVFAAGSVGGFLVIYLTARRLWRVPRDRTFWVYFIALTSLLGIMVHGLETVFGVAHICLLGMVLLGMAFLAAQAPRMKSGLKVLLMAGLLVDLCVGILLNLECQSRTFVLRDVYGHTSVVKSPELLGVHPLSNVRLKQRYKLVFLGDEVADGAAVLWCALFLGYGAVMICVARELFVTDRVGTSK